MVDYGDGTITTYLVCISDAESGGSPSGNRAFFKTTRHIGGNETFSQKIEHIAGNNHYSTKNGKYSPQIKLSELTILKYSTNNNTQSFNNVIGFLRNLQSTGHATGYLWVRNDNDSENVDLGYLGETTTDYLEGYITRLDWEMRGPIYVFRSIEWEGTDN